MIVQRKSREGVTVQLFEQSFPANKGVLRIEQGSQNWPLEPDSCSAAVDFDGCSFVASENTLYDRSQVLLVCL